MTLPSQFTKTPLEELDYTFNWAGFLAGDTITTSTWVVQTGLTKVSDSIASDGQSTTIWLSGGTPGGGTVGVGYDVTNEIVTAQGRTATRTVTFQIRHTR